MDYLNLDSVIGFNLFAYCGNDLVNYADPSGYLPQWAKWANWFGQSDYVGIRVPKSAFKNFYFNPLLDNIGPAYNIEIGYLNSILKGIWYF